MVAHQVVANDAEEQLYLQTYFGKPPDSYQRARFFLMCQISHVFYAMGFLFIGSAGKPVDWSEPVPEFRDWNRRFWTGEVRLTDQSSKIAYARSHLKQLLANVELPRYRESLRIVSERHAVS